MSLIRFKARALIGTAIIADGVDVLRRPQPHEEVAAAALETLSKTVTQLPSIAPTTAVRASAIGQTAGGALIATSIAPRLGALASLTATLPAILLGYQFWKVKDDDALRDRLRTGFLFHLVVIGADLLILTIRKKKPTKTAKRT
jgi:uncharacterized membrane protein YphA (DoxX/SURF4 family)